MQKLAIGLTTCNRSYGLLRLLKGIKKLNNKYNNFDISVLLIDNDKEKSSLNVFNKVKKSFPFKIYYYVEKIKGIPYGRNKVLDIAIKKKFDFLIFIDDDELPSKNWLNELMHIQRKYNADIVAGPSIRIIPKQTPLWVKEGNFYNNQRKIKNGANISEAYTNNVLFKIDMLKKEKIKFDERLKTAGGSDALFSRQLINLRYKAKWAEKAITYEYLTKERTTVDWLIRRYYRVGTSAGLCTKYMNLSSIKKIRHIFSGLLRIGYGFARIFIVPFKNKSYLIMSLCYIAKGLGMCLGTLGVKYHEYK